MMKTILICVVLNLFGSSFADNSEFIFDQNMRNDLAIFINSTIECSAITGLALSLVHERKVLYSEGFGFIDIEKGRKATGSSKFAIGSLTKAFTSALLADLIENDDKVTFDTKVKDIIGEQFKLIDGREKEVTIRDILAHKTGILDYNLLLISDVISADQLLRSLKYMPAPTALRVRFNYSNYMYAVAGIVAERLGNATWGHLVAERFLRRLGMNDTGIVNDSSPIDDLSEQYATKNGSVVAIDRTLLRSLNSTGPSGAIISTADDMAKWMMFHLDDGRDTEGQQLVDLGPTYQGEMVLPSNSHWLPELPMSEVSVSYNLGWMTHAYRGYRRLGHTGNVHSFSSHLYLFPDKKSGVFLIINGPRSEKAVRMAKLIALYVSDLLIGEEPWLNASTACTFPVPWRPQPPTPQPTPPQQAPYTWNIPRKMEEYVGTFTHKGFGDIQINIENGKHLVLGFGKHGKMHVYPINETSFLGIHVGTLWFITSSDDGIGPLSLGFSIDEDVTGLLFPLNFVGKLTLFDKVDESDESDERHFASAGPEPAPTKNIATPSQVLCGYVMIMFVTSRNVVFG